MNILVSAYLLGVEYRYNGKGVLEPEVEELLHIHHLIPVCPEIMGGFATPRAPAERIQGRVVTRDSEDVTMAYQKEAEMALKPAQLYGCRVAILEERSLSCGRGQICDETFTTRLIPGNGVYAELLEQRGIGVYGENRIARLLKKLERY